MSSCDLRKTFSFANFTRPKKFYVSPTLLLRLYRVCRFFYKNRRNCSLLYRLSKNNVAFFDIEYDPQTLSIEKFEKLKHNSRMTSYFFIYEVFTHMMKTRTFRVLDVIHEIHSLFNSSGLSRKWCKHE